MKILAVDTSTTVATVAVGTEDKLLANYYIDDKLTHSQKLLPMIDRVLSDLDMSVKDIDAFSCVIGPGSFTGLRIGVATVKGMALERKIAPVTSTMAMAYGFYGSDMDIIPLIDARNENVFFGKYRFENEKIAELTEPSAVNVNELIVKRPTVFMGDGAVKYKEILAKNELAVFAPPHINMGNAAGVYMAALDMIKNGKTVQAKDLTPLYIRKCQAEQDKEREMQK